MVTAYEKEYVYIVEEYGSEFRAIHYFRVELRSCLVVPCKHRFDLPGVHMHVAFVQPPSE